MSLFKKFKSILKKKPKKVEKPKKKPIPKPEKPAEKAKPIQAGPPKSKKVLAGKPIVKKKDLRGIYKILKEPHISEKATVLTGQNKYVFKVYPRANKIEVKKAIENLYGVRVKNINIVNVHRKRRMLRGIKGFKTGYKKAIATLEKGEKIEIMPH